MYLLLYVILNLNSKEKELFPDACLDKTSSSF